MLYNSLFSFLFKAMVEILCYLICVLWRVSNFFNRKLRKLCISKCLENGCEEGRKFLQIYKNEIEPLYKELLDRYMKIRSIIPF